MTLKNDNMNCKDYNLMKSLDTYEFSSKWVLWGESMIKYTFSDPCQEKCKIAINHALTYQSFKYYLI
jgi:hypothetical protein